MSYRTHIDGKQLFGNNDCYAEWLEFVKAQGIAVNEDGQYDGQITDFMGALEVLEKIVIRLTRQREALIEKLAKVGNNKIPSLFDFTTIPSGITEDNSLFDELYDLVNSSYAFIPFAFYLICKDKLEEVVSESDNRFHCYKLKSGEAIHIKAN